jgi:M6 family metalloprotease-like protein
VSKPIYMRFKRAVHFFFLLWLAAFAAASVEQTVGTANAASTGQTTNRKVGASNPGDQIFEGTFLTISGGNSKQYYLGFSQNGQIHNLQLIIDPKLLAELGGSAGLVDQPVRVTGTKKPTRSGNFVIEVTALEATVYSATGLMPDPDPVIGNKKFITVLCRFSDNPSTPLSRNQLDLFMTDPEYGMQDYFNDVSAGMLSLNGSITLGWYNLPEPRSYYIKPTGPGGADEIVFSRLVPDCAKKAEGVINFNDYYGINLVFNSKLDGTARAGLHRMKLDETEKSWRYTLLPPVTYLANSANAGVGITSWAHEMGHTFGMDHSFKGNSDTGNDYTVMSGNDAWCVANEPETWHPLYGCLPQYPHVHNLKAAGWMPTSFPNRIAQPALNIGQTYTYELDPLSRRKERTNTLPWMVRIPAISAFGDDNYSIEARESYGRDSKMHVRSDGIVIHKRVYNNDNGDTAFVEALTSPGDSYTIASMFDVNITVLFDRITPAGTYVVKVTANFANR